MMEYLTVVHFSGSICAQMNFVDCTVYQYAKARGNAGTARLEVLYKTLKKHKDRNKKIRFWGGFGPILDPDSNSA